jgi:hypothetical protein
VRLALVTSLITAEVAKSIQYLHGFRCCHGTTRREGTYVTPMRVIPCVSTDPRWGCKQLESAGV